MDKTEFTKAFAVLQSYFPDTKLPKETAGAYYLALADIPGDVFLDAVMKCVASCKFWPKVAELREAAETLMFPEKSSGLEAWGLVVSEVRRGVGYPYAGTPINPVQTTITDPVILACVRAVGGWTALQVSTNDEDISNRSQFVKCYEQMATRQHELNRQLPQVRERVERLSGPSSVADVLKKLTEKK